ncbi:HAD-IA family hydrolase [Rhizobium aegyptiacum]|uniref:HAD-IA family hydrolase n=1 Tax=Rhizobium aegyptiacum TaxID=1764550 RepID=UPI0007E597E9|nr:HAD-IA family hydrolase [Rhizobium aegyptiacum]
MKLALFDCDGTLVDSAGLIHETMRRTFEEFGKAEPRLEDTKAIIGLSLDIAIARMQGRPHVAWGYASVDELIANGADAIAYHPNEILRHFS